MNGPQDMGGRMRLGLVAPEADEPLWHAEWEPRALALTIACGALGHWTLDESRHARESLPWDLYLTASYYEIWITALERLLETHGEVSVTEREAGTPLTPGRATGRILDAKAVAPVLAKGGPSLRDVSGRPAFAPGDRVRMRNLQPRGHTRLPGYARGRSGVVTATHGAHVFADDNAHGRGENPQWLYTVDFTGEELWGPESEPGLTVSIDAWEPYLERA